MPVLGGLVGLAFAIAAFLKFGPGTDVSFQLRGYQVLSDRQVQVQVEVARPPGSAVFCVLRARGADGSEVARAERDVPPSSRRDTVFEPVLSTSQRAVTGEVVGCKQGRATTTSP
jgi:hypothetical protein